MNGKKIRGLFDFGIGLNFHCPNREEAWLREYRKEYALYDLTSFCTTLLTILLALARVNFRELTTWELVYNSIGTAQYFAVIFFFQKHRPWFARWREYILVPHVTSTLLIFVCMAVRQPQFNTFHPLEIPTGQLRALLHLLLIPFVFLRHSVSYILPAKIFGPLSFFNAMMVLFSTAGRCSDEVAAVPGQGNRYHDIAATIEEFINRCLPFSFRPRDDPVGVFALSEAGACLAVNGTVQVLMGYFIPLAIICTVELCSRRAFQKKYNIRSREAAQRPSVLLLQQVCLLPFQSIFFFQTFVFVLTMVARIRRS